VIDAKPPSSPQPAAILPARAFVRKWTLADLAPAAAGPLSRRSYARGREMFAAAGCFACHRVGADGGSFGPDLTGSGGRFSVRDLLESILEPSKVVSDQYQAVKIQLADGRVVAGRIINMSGDDLKVNTDMRDPDMIANVKRADVRAIKPSEVSMMPEALLDTLSQEEILDLLAYLLSGGDPAHAAFR
jgi:putative heme-binding domain-containing protein